MNRMRVSLGLLLVFAVMILGPSRAAAQACSGGLGDGFIAPSELNREGLTERPADFAITKGPGNCFASGNSIRVTYNALLTVPVQVVTASVNNYAITDANHTLVVNVSTTTGVGSGNLPQTVIEFDVITGTTDAAASIVLKNLRFDVTSLGDASALNAYLSSTLPATPPTPTQVGEVRNTISTALGQGVTTEGIGVQSAGGPLGTQVAMNFASNPAWASTLPFRVAIAAPPFGDIPTGPTSMTFDVEGIPAGVTVTFPATMTLVGPPEIQWKASSSTLTATGGSLQVTYNTVINAGATSFTLNLATGSAAADTNSVPTIGVQIAAASGNGTATIRVVFGPTLTAQFPGDATGSLALPPVYTKSIAASLPSRRIIASSTGAPVPFFVITPTTTVLLYDYATDLVKYNTGIAVANTAADSTIFNTVGQTGSITLYMFQSLNPTPIIYTPKATDGRGLNAAGQLAPGSIFAITISEALMKAGATGLVGNFSGYVIAYCQFQYGHGFSIVFNPDGIGTAVPALFLGPAGGNATLRYDTLQVGLNQ